MFSRLFGKKQALPEFSEIDTADIKDHYFYRSARWDVLDETMIQVFDNRMPRVITMDPWPQQIFMDADGQRTVKQYVYHMASLYGKKETVPPELDQSILKMLRALVKDGLIGLDGKSRALPYHLEVPVSRQDHEKAKTSMKMEGFVEG